MDRPGWLLNLAAGVTSYADAWALQRSLVTLRQHEEITDGLILLEHEPVFTIGRSVREEHLLFPRDHLVGMGFQVYEVERGGSITYHGPGQLVGYPIIDLRAYDEDIVKFMRSLEKSIILTLADFGIRASRVRGYPGVWVEDEKIAAVGVAVKRKVTMHGFALNVAPALEHFAYINPCGLGRPVTSMSRVLGRPVDGAAVRAEYVRRFAEVFALTLVPSTREALLGTATPA